MDAIINQQIQGIVEDLNSITNPYERATVRAQFLLALSGLSQVGEVSCSASTASVKGKDAIKNNNVKPITFEEEPQGVILEEGKAITLNETNESEAAADTSNAPNEISLEDQRVVVQVEAEDGSMIDLDITEAYNLTADFTGSEEERTELATQIASYNLTPVYETLTGVTSSNDKLMLAYYMQEYGIEEINAFVHELTDGNYSDVYEFATDDTIGNLVADLEKAAEEE